eukprot:Selendium_serpulae@DN6212_c0_g2_i1.p2
MLRATAYRHLPTIGGRLGAPMVPRSLLNAQPKTPFVSPGFNHLRAAGTLLPHMPTAPTNAPAVKGSVLLTPASARSLGDISMCGSVSRCFSSRAKEIGAMETIATVLPKLNSMRFARMPNRIDLDNFITALFCLAFFWGGSTGTANGNMFADIALHDTYFVVGHFHFIAVVSVAAGALKGITHWSNHFISPFSNSFVRNPMTFLAAASTAVFASGLFASMHAWGLEGHCRRVYDYTDTSNAPIIGTVLALCANISAVMTVYWLINSI